MKERCSLRQRRQASALPLVLIAIVLLMVTGLGMLRAGFQVRAYAARTSDETGEALRRMGFAPDLAATGSTD